MAFTCCTAHNLSTKELENKWHARVTQPIINDLPDDLFSSEKDRDGCVKEMVSQRRI